MATDFSSVSRDHVQNWRVMATKYSSASGDHIRTKSGLTLWCMSIYGHGFQLRFEEIFTKKVGVSAAIRGNTHENGTKSVSTLW